MSRIFRTFPADSLDVKAIESPLDLRLLKLALQSIIKIYEHVSAPASECVFHPQFENLYDKCKNALKQPVLESKKHIHNSDIPLDIV